MQEVHTIERSILLGAALLHICSLEHSAGQLDNPSLLICNSVDRYSRPVVCALALTLLRYSDLNSEVLRNYLSGVPTYVKQNKTSSLYQVKPLSDKSISYATDISIPEVPFHASYSSARYAINSVLGRNLRKYLSDSFTATHIFRHLRSSFFISQGVPISVVSSYLGHSSGDSIHSYIHKDLIDSNLLVT
jgi:integrase